jgi:hypothetical protein
MGVVYCLARKVIFCVAASKSHEENWSHALAATLASAGPPLYAPANYPGVGHHPTG